MLLLSYFCACVCAFSGSCEQLTFPSVPLAAAVCLSLSAVGYQQQQISCRHKLLGGILGIAYCGWATLLYADTVSCVVETGTPALFSSLFAFFSLALSLCPCFSLRACVFLSLCLSLPLSSSPSIFVSFLCLSVALLHSRTHSGTLARFHALAQATHSLKLCPCCRRFCLCLLPPSTFSVASCSLWR